jgi:hypothetical protein
MSRDAKNKALSAEEPACAVCGVEGGHAPGCWVGQSGTAPAAEEPTETTAPAEDKDEE